MDEKNKDPLLSFGFETFSSSNIIGKRFKFAERIIKDTNYLVIIGYSFPNDNTEIDERLINVINSDSLKKIIFQDPYNDGSFLRDAFRIRKEIQIEHINKVDEFILPREYKLPV